MLRVLLIDDDADKPLTSAHDYLEALQVTGMEVEKFTSPQRAASHIGRNPRPEDIVILDMMMPNDLPTGSERLDPLSIGAWILKRKLRSPDSRYLRVPVLMLTNRDLSEFRPGLDGIDRTWLRHKSNVPAFHLPELVKEILHQANELS